MPLWQWQRQQRRRHRQETWRPNGWQWRTHVRVDESVVLLGSIRCRTTKTKLGAFCRTPKHNTTVHVKMPTYCKKYFLKFIIIIILLLRNNMFTAYKNRMVSVIFLFYPIHIFT